MLILGPCLQARVMLSVQCPASVQDTLSIPPASPLASSHNGSIHFFFHVAQDIISSQEGPSHLHAASAFIPRVRGLIFSGQGTTMMDSFPSESQCDITPVLVAAMCPLYANCRMLHASSLLIVRVTLIHVVSRWY